MECSEVAFGPEQDKMRPIVNAAINFGFCKMWVISRLDEKLLASQEGLCYELIYALQNQSGNVGEITAV